MQYRQEIFIEQFPLVKHFLCHLTYYRVIGQQYRASDLKSPFWTLTINAHLAEAVILWCMVFGTDDNPTHWKSLSQSEAETLRRDFQKTLYDQTEFTETSWPKYWRGIVTFRNQYIAHRELSYDKPVPFLDGAAKVTYVYDRWIRKIISPDIFEEPPLEEFTVKLQQTIAPMIAQLLQFTKTQENPQLL